MRIDINTDESGQPTVTIDGEPIGDRTLRRVSEMGMLHDLVWLDDEPQYDVQMFMDGRPRASVPPKSTKVEAEYDRASRS